jgi:hypothetical protein
MARQVGPQERKPEHSLVLKHVAEMRTFLANSIRARSFGLQKAAYKTAADTSFTYHIRSTWQTGRCPYKPVWKLSFGSEGEVAGRSIKLDAFRLR